MINRYDYLNIAFYFLFIVGIGVYFSRLSKNTSDYFRGGGALPWWITGASVWMAGFSAWTFTGAAAKIYETGPYVLVLYYQNILPLFVMFFFTSYRFRRLRVVTPVEALRLRFGVGTQQFYTWIRLPVQLLFGAFSLNAVGVFMAAVFQIEITIVLIALGLVITMISLFGGAMGVAAADFVQMFVIVTVALAVAALALLHPAIGGLGGLIEKSPDQYYHWNQIARPGFIGLWFAALTLNTIFGQNSLSDDKAAKYMMAQSDRHARMMLIIPFVGALLGPFLWMIPPMAARILHPELASQFPVLRFPNEGAFLSTAIDVLPQGMLGLLICGIFAASLTDMSGVLNWGSGLLLRNFYLPIVNPQCPEKKLMALSRGAALVLGLLFTTAAVVISRYRSLNLFDLLNQVGTSLLMPLAIPACLGMFYKRTPGWSAWSTVLVGFTISWVTKDHVTPEMVAWLPGFGGPYNGEEKTLFRLIATVALGAPVCVAWFFATSLFYERTSPAYKKDVEEFFARANTPLPNDATANVEKNTSYPRAVGRLCVLYGIFVVLLSAIPNAPRGRLCFIACGGLMVAIGALVLATHRRATPATAAPA